jgi:NADH:ubiquinone oxidoreductase subunit F (NADH-binding)
LILFWIQDSGEGEAHGFSTGMKWKLAARAGESMKNNVICNADEGEPGTFKDRKF